MKITRQLLTLRRTKMVDQVQRASILKHAGQNDLVRMSGVSKGTISKFLNGKNMASFDTLQRLAIALETRLVIEP